MLLFDIGDNRGDAVVAGLAKGYKVIAVEAAPKIYSELVKNFIYNPDVKPIKFAVSDKDYEVIEFYEADEDGLSTLNKEWLTSPNSRFFGKPYREIRCKTITIDKLIETYGIPELIKIDVEGGEYSCISSLSRKVNHLCFEWASEVTDITFKCIDHLSALGFANFYLQMQDNYTFRPNPEQYFDANTLKNKLLATTPKVDWGMIWCK